MIKRFNRYELKYVIDVAKRDEIVRDLVEQMLPDAYADANAQYRVTSLYYDSPEFACYWAKLEGLKYRRKVRIRVYDLFAEAPDHLAMLEIKQRINRTVQKRRVRMLLGDAIQLCAGTQMPVMGSPQDEAVVAEVDYLRRASRLQPAVVISYLRMAYAGGPYDPGLRVTFDSDLTCREPWALLGRGAASHRFMSDEKCIMEVKANNAVPIWISRMLARHGCVLQRVSKYCAGVAQLRQSSQRAAETGEQHG